MTLETQTPPATRPSQSIRLDIAGTNLMIAGTFEQWVPLVMEGAADGRAVQLLVDVTSPEAASTPAHADGLLFSFEAHDIQRTPLGHRARGDISFQDHTAPAELLLQAPPAHTPFAVLSFDLPEGFEGVWDEMSKRADDRQGETEVRARGWLRPPTVASA